MIELYDYSGRSCVEHGDLTWIFLQAASQTEQRACRSGICNRFGQDTEGILGKEILWIFPECNVGGRKYGSVQR